MEGSSSAVVKGVLLGTAGGSDFIEGLHKIYLGVTGQGEKDGINIIRDGLFHGDSASYDQAKITLGLSSLISLFQINPGVNAGSQPTSNSALGNGEVFETEAVVGADGKITYVTIIENTQLPAVRESLVPSISTETAGGIIAGPVIISPIVGASGANDIVSKINIDQKPNVSNDKLKNIVNDLYKGQGGKNTVGNGTTMDAVRNELLTGQPTNGKFHIQKLIDYQNALQRRLRAGDLNDYDKSVVNALLEDINKALNGK